MAECVVCLRLLIESSGFCFGTDLDEMNYMLTTNFIQQFDEVQEAFCSGVRGFFISLCHLTRGVTKWHSPRIRKASPGRSLPQLEGLINMPCKPQRFRVWIPGARLEKSSLVKSRNLCPLLGVCDMLPRKMLQKAPYNEGLPRYPQVLVTSVKCYQSASEGEPYHYDQRGNPKSFAFPGQH